MFLDVLMFQFQLHFVIFLSNVRASLLLRSAALLPSTVPGVTSLQPHQSPTILPEKIKTEGKAVETNAIVLAVKKNVSFSSFKNFSMGTQFGKHQLFLALKRFIDFSLF